MRNPFDITAILKMMPVIALLLIVLHPSWLGAVRIKDLANISGVRDNQLVGYGLVVGLDGTGGWVPCSSRRS